MRHTLLVAFIGFSFLLAVLPGHAQSRVALVIGNSAYRNVAPLPNTQNDANDIAASFQRLGFTVNTLHDATFDDMRRALLQLGRDAQGADMAIVYFAGHGMEISGENWLIPVDAELRSDRDAENEAVSLKSAMRQVANAATLGLVILDSCRDNPFTAQMKRVSRGRAVDRGLARVEPTDNVLVAYAAKDGTVASDGRGRNSPFTTALLNNLETPGVEIRFLLAAVRDEVLAATNRAQQPFVYGSLSRQAIYLKPPQSATVSPLAPSRPAASVSNQAPPGAVALAPQGAATSAATGGPCGPTRAVIILGPCPPDQRPGPASSIQSPAIPRPAENAPALHDSPHSRPDEASSIAAPPLRPAIDAVSCATAVTRQNNYNVLSGFVDSAENLSRMKKIADETPNTSVGNITIVGKAACGILRVLEKTLFSANSPGIDIGPSDIFRDGDVLKVEIHVPRNARYLEAFYLQTDGTVLHLTHPAGVLVDSTRPTLVYGDGKDGRRKFTVGTPFGQETIIAVASNQPIFGQDVPATQSSTDFLAALRRAFPLENSAGRPDKVVTATAKFLSVQSR